VAGVGVFALSAAAFAAVVAVALARLWGWVRSDSVLDAPVWSWAPGGAGALAVLALLISFVTVFVHFWSGATNQVLAEIGARPLDPARHPQVVNVVEALSLGLGRPLPHLAVVADDAPNALSLRSTRTRVLCVTEGLTRLPRDEIEAVCAHELGHLWARDAHFVTSGMVALARARRIGSMVLLLGMGVLVLVGILIWEVGTFLWGTAVVGVLLVVVGWSSSSVLRRLELAVRHSADEIADVLAVRLARNPASLGAVCARLAVDDARVASAGRRSELLWFVAVEKSEFEADPAVHSAEMATFRTRRRAELVQRAVAAYSTAGVPLPAAVNLAPDDGRLHEGTQER
jgi:heat shock protein HtpX